MSDETGADDEEHALEDAARLLDEIEAEIASIGRAIARLDESEARPDAETQGGAEDSPRPGT